VNAEDGELERRGWQRRGSSGGAVSGNRAGGSWRTSPPRVESRTAPSRQLTTTRCSPRGPLTRKEGGLEQPNPGNRMFQWLRESGCARHLLPIAISVLSCRNRVKSNQRPHNCLRYDALPAVSAGPAARRRGACMHCWLVLIGF